ncbi:MAG: Nitroimidazol reductase NimA, pyridoxamine 5'-phosphate oxidase superfamily [Chloroflexi bacterium]|jgi:general stress protein 26|nr:MAG: Nitroimidazol reductase NimA, pyridoxamine 5'-phosphate oxidase superfamily [Chloroflexota bacterium]|tara:strand:- start:14959 stop:15402 length:444 start_codon:yes stop_codon:yes gene_type:complete
MTRNKKDFQLNSLEIASLIQASRILNLSTINKNGLPHLVPMWFITDENGLINFTSYHKSQKIVNLIRDKRIVVMVESGNNYEDLKGITIEGVGIIDNNESLLLKTIDAITNKYGVNRTISDNNKMLTKRVNVKIIPKKIISWDLSKS